MPRPLNAIQSAVARTYGGGDYAYITDVEQAKDVGDTLFTFLMLELEDEGSEPMTRETALVRLAIAQRQIEHARDQVEDL